VLQLLLQLMLQLLLIAGSVTLLGAIACLVDRR
jgi:hypothetical protein